MRWPSILSSIFLVSCCMYTYVDSASRFLFDLEGYNKECFYEVPLGRGSSGILMFRFYILDVRTNDAVDVLIRTDGHDLHIFKEWRNAQSGYVSEAMPNAPNQEICFQKKKGPAKMRIYYSFDHISLATTKLTLNARATMTVSSAKPEENVMGKSIQSSDDERDEKVGIVEFDIIYVSPTVMSKNTRATLVVPTISVSSSNASLHIRTIHGRVTKDASWNWMQEIESSDLDIAVALSGGHAVFDITYAMEDVFTKKEKSVAFSLHAQDGSFVLAGAPVYPRIFLEDVGMDVIMDIAFLKDRIFSLRGELSYTLIKERHSRDVAESANARMKWFSFIVNTLLISIALAQVLYIRKLLGSGY